MAKTQDRILRREQIVPNELQPRKHFSVTGIAEMVANFREHGFDPSLSRLLVRPLNEVVVEHEEDSSIYFVKDRAILYGKNGHPAAVPSEFKTVATTASAAEAKSLAEKLEQFEIVCGERRWRAAEELEIDEIPVSVKSIDDLQALELQLVENLQRESLTPMEEGMAYQRLRDMGQTVKQIAEHVGRPEDLIKDRLSLCRLDGSPVAVALDSGAIMASHALELAKVPSPAMRLELLEKTLHPMDGSDAPWPVLALREHIKRDYVRELRGAVFDLEDPDLVSAEFEAGSSEMEDGAEKNSRRLWGGACQPPETGHAKVRDASCFCPFNQKPEGAQAKSSSRMCVNLECFKMKEIADHEKWRCEPHGHYKEGEFTTLSHGENAALWNQVGMRLANHSPYVELNEAPAQYELKGTVQNPPLWKTLIKGGPGRTGGPSGTGGFEVPIVLGRDAAGKVHELVLHDLAKKAAHLNGHLIFRDSVKETRTDEELSSTADRPAPKSDDERKKDSLKKAGQRDAASSIQKVEMAAMVAAAEKCVVRGHVNLPGPCWTLMALSLLDEVGEAGMFDELASRRTYEIDATAVSKMSLAERVGLVVESLLLLTSGTEQWAKVLGVNLGQVRKTASRRHKSEAGGQPRKHSGASVAAESERGQHE